MAVALAYGMYRSAKGEFDLTSETVTMFVDMGDAAFTYVWAGLHRQCPTCAWHPTCGPFVHLLFGQALAHARGLERVSARAHSYVCCR